MTSVLTAVGSRWESQVATALEGSSQVQLSRRCADLADLLACAASGMGTVAVVSADLRGLALSVVARLRESGVEVVGVSDPADESTEVRLHQLGIHRVVPVIAPLADLESTLLAAGEAALGLAALAPGGLGSSPDGIPGLAWEDPTSSVDGYAAATPTLPGPADQPGPARGRVLAVWGPVGSPGRTTIAVNLAAELSRGGVRVLLVDADTYGGCVAQTLSLLDEAPGLVAACRAADQGTFDLMALARVAPEITRGLRVLTGIPKAERWPEIRPAALERVLDAARSLADLVVVDVGFCLEDDEELSYDTAAPRRNQATLTTLQVADLLVAVGSCDPVSLQRLVRGLQELGTVRSPQPLVVVNRMRPGPVGSPAHVQVADAMARFAGVEDLTFIPDDPGALDAAMFAGQALLECAPGSPARAAVAALASRLSGIPAPKTRRSAAGQRSWFVRRGRR
jgi:MinD-like ATPase involved in chromosome partitioning or flagellar assembly